MGHMPVDFYTKTLGNSAPPSAPKADPKDKKLVKKWRVAKKWEQADRYSGGGPVRGRQKTVAQRDAEMEVTIENIYDGDDWQEDIADAFIDNIVDPVVNSVCCCFNWQCCGCFGNCCSCCCGKNIDDDDDVEEGKGFDDSDWGINPDAMC
jgi:hypothetical protein